MDNACQRCGGAMEAGHAFGRLRYDPVERASLVFVIPGVPTSLNPFVAFQQGKEGEPEDRKYRVDGYRCTECGSVEFFATEPYKSS